MQKTVDKWGRIDVLVNNASFQGKSVENFEDITRERLEFTFHSNILNYFTVTQAAVKHMKEGSAIININSIQGYSPSPGVMDYSCTKVGTACLLLKSALSVYTNYDRAPCGVNSRLVVIVGGTRTVWLLGCSPIHSLLLHKVTSAADTTQF